MDGHVILPFFCSSYLCCCDVINPFLVILASATVACMRGNLVQDAFEGSPLPRVLATMEDLTELTGLVLCVCIIASRAAPAVRQLQIGEGN